MDINYVIIMNYDKLTHNHRLKNRYTYNNIIALVCDPSEIEFDTCSEISYDMHCSS